MDITTLAAMRDKRVGVLIHLKQENFRNIGSEWNLYATIELLDTIGKKAIPFTLLVTSNRRPHSIRAQLEAAGLAYVETPLPPVVRTPLGRPDSPNQQALTHCIVCQKSSFDDASG